MRWEGCAKPTTGCICAGLNDPVRLSLEGDWARLSGGRIVCICLQDRDDRWAERSACFHAYGLCRLVRFYRPTRPSTDELQAHSVRSVGAYGCWTSHQRMANESARVGAKRALMFEDDVDFLPAGAGDAACCPTTDQLRRFHDRLTRAADAMESGLPNGWDIFYLGHAPMVGWPTTQWGIMRTYSLLLHAYVLSPKGMALLASADFSAYAKARGRELNIDEWSCCRLRQYAVVPQLAVQADSVSSNSLKWPSEAQQVVFDYSVPRIIRLHRRFAWCFDLFAYVIFHLVCLFSLIFCIRVFLRAVPIPPTPVHVRSN